VGRFDLHDRPPVRYLSEQPEHALGEVLSPFRGTRFHRSYLRQSGCALALAEITLLPSLWARILDCTDPVVLSREKLRPDELAHHDRSLTQAIARRLHAQGDETGSPAGLRWWSALTGAWHTTVVFTDREGAGEVILGIPRRVEPGDPELVGALEILGIRVG